MPERMTLAEFSAFPWPANEAWELIWEAPVLAPRPRPVHQSLVMTLARFIEDSLAPRPHLLTLIEVDVKLPPARSWLVPDITVVDTNEVDVTKPPLECSPLLAVEVLSPGSASVDVGPKRDAYAEASVAEYWTVDPEIAAAAIYVRPTDGEYEKVTADRDGYVASPLLGVSFRLSGDGVRFKVLTR